MHIYVSVAFTICMYVEYDNVEDLKAQFDLAPIKVLEDFFAKYWKKECLQTLWYAVVIDLCAKSHISM